MDGERRLDQPGDAGGRHGVADHRLHRAEHGARRRSLRGAEDARASVSSSAASPAGVRGAVRFEQPDASRRVEPGGLPGALEREHLALDRGVHQARVAPVAGHAGAADDRVDAVAVALRVGAAA